MRRLLPLLAAVSCSLVSAASAQVPLLLNYQGRLVDGTNLVNATKAISLRLYDAASLGTLLYEDSNAVTVVDGLYSTFLGDNTTTGTLTSALGATNVYLEIAVDGSALAPRERLAAVAYAVVSAGVQPGGITTGMIASGAVQASHIATGAVTSVHLASNAVTAAALATGAVTSNKIASGAVGADKLADTYWSLGGNAGVVDGTEFLGTSDGSALELRVNGQRALRIESGLFGPRMIGGHPTNSVSDEGGVVGGGGFADNPNRVTDSFGFVGGGVNNQAGDDSGSDADFATVGGGLGNRASDDYATVAGGRTNVAGSFGSTVGGGRDNKALEFYTTVGGGRANIASNLEATISGGHSNRASGAASFVGGGQMNAVLASYGVVAGGDSNRVTGTASFIGAGETNVVAGTSAAIAGGRGNSAGGSNAFVGAGLGNEAEGPLTVVGGGTLNTIDTSSRGAFIGGGENNVLVTGAQWSAIVAGNLNRLSNAYHAVIGGGQQNFIQTYADYGVIDGGSANNIQTGASYSVIGGGQGNVVSSNATHAVVPGGVNNRAGAPYTFAAGRRAKAEDPGTFVWADAENADFTSTASNQFLVRASGGVGIGTATPDGTMHVIGTTNSVRLIIGPDAGLNRDSEIFLAEGDDDEFGMTLAYDGTANRFEIHGVNTWVTSAPIVSVTRDSGLVGIGTTNLNAAYQLSVGGKIRCEEIVVETGWADFVFEKEYVLPPLDLVEASIEQNGHLPGVPDAAQVAREGVNLGDMQVVLLQKIEELTLYVIQQQKDIAALRAELEAVKEPSCD